ncbi:hypothetical protein [Luteibacter sp. dw_328]|uniref:hypothetical protein n=1 Tax=Luteibacter sp. dw_328 TaxID=2719796 RepID=UPI001BD3B9A7|nr:hypothetical protein [Luteibacter sp. dw_328]
MDKETRSPLSTVSALDAFDRWLEAEPAQGKVRQALMVLSSQTRHALGRNEDPPAAEVIQLFAWHRDRFGGLRPTEPVTAKWLPTSQVRTWWSGYENSRRQFFQAAGVELEVVLVIDRGGGRGNATIYRLAFAALGALTEPAEAAETPSADPSMPPGFDRAFHMTYELEPAKCAALWWPLLGRPFSMRSGRGVAFIGIVALPFAIAMICGAALCMIYFSSPTSISKAMGPLLTTGLLAAVVTWVQRPFWSLPMLRITIAPDWLLAFSQTYGQFRLTRDSDSKTGGRFSLVRFHGTCPVCAGKVEIRDGGAAYPGRLVGCCSDSPREHVFSFDAVTRAGRLLVDR